MKNTVKKFYRVGLAGVLGISLLGLGNMAFASNDNISYNFSIQPGHANSYSSTEYRQTTNSQNQWKVNLAFSSEGAGTVTTFWLDKAGTRVSDVKSVTQGSGANYTDAFSTASQSNVRLGAENNNYSTSGYTASGYWDEEVN